MTPAEFCQSSLRATQLLASRRVFFIVGCQKSGTTWLQAALDAHPRVCCGGEGHFTDLLAPMLEIALGKYNTCEKVPVKLGDDDLFAVARLLTDRTLARYLSAADDPSVIEAVGDKTPESALALPALDRLYPGFRCIHIIRDGRDGAVSGWAHLQRVGQTDRFGSFAAYAPYFASRHWRGYIETARASASALGERYLEVRYEALHEDPHREMRRLLEFLAVDSGPDAVACCVEGGAFERLSGGRQRGDEQRDSHFRKGVVGDWRSHFDEPTLEAFEAAAGGLLGELGYQRAPMAVAAHA